MSRIGIYAGTFDPVHAGHVAFALQSIEAAKLDRVYFLPERRPRTKQQVEHFGHRVAMLKRAFEPHRKLKVMELVDINFSVARTLPKLREMFPGDELVFLFGSDVVPGISKWPNATQLLKDNEFVVGLRHDDKREDIHKVIELWQTQPKLVTVFESYAPDVSSGKIREALRLRKTAKGTLKSVERYSDRNWLYVSLA